MHQKVHRAVLLSDIDPPPIFPAPRICLRSDDTPVYLLGNSPWLKIERGVLPYPVEFDQDEKPVKLSGF
jgi:hypothetical protein